MRRNRREIAVGCALLAVLAAIGCQRQPPKPPGAGDNAAATSQAGSVVHDWVRQPATAPGEQDVPCPRVLSAGPNVTEICAALGALDCLIGRTRFCTYPPAALQIPSFGGLNDVNAEVLVGLNPELIIVSGESRNIADQLDQLGLEHVTIPDVSLDDLFVGIGRIGEHVRRPRTAAALLAGIRGDLEAVRQRYADVPPARVLIVIAPLPDPPTQTFAAGPGSFYDDLLRLAGHRNAAAAADRSFTPIALEFVLEVDPDAIIELAPDATGRPNGDADALGVWAKVGSLKAVRDERVHVLAGQQHMILGPRIAQTFEALCATIAGDDEARQSE